MTKKNNPLIYVVEDDPAFRKLVESYLKTNKFINVKTFSSGEESIEGIEKEVPDIVIQDYDLVDGMNGLETMKVVKSKHPEVEYLFLSGQSSINVAVDTIKEGAFDYVVKDNATKHNIIHRIKKIIYINKLIKDKKNSRHAVVLISAGYIILMLLIFLYWKLWIQPS